MSGPFASRFARSVTVTDAAGTYTARAFLQAVSVKDPETPKATAAGVTDPRRWLLIMEPLTLTGPVTVSDGTNSYALLRWEDVSGHVEGVLCLKGGGGANA